MRLAIADPPYPPMFGERRDRPDGPLRLTRRSRAVRWYGDMHPDAAEFDELTTHRDLLERLVDDYDGWALATTPDGLQAYFPLPVSARIMVWHRPRSMPGGHRIVSRWEPVIVSPPEDRRARTLDRVSDVLTANPPAGGFVGAKPPVWTRWVLDALGYDPAHDTLVDLFPGSGAVSAAADGLLPLPREA